MAISFSLSDLNQFTGTSAHYSHWTGRLTYTDGVKHLSDHGCAWLVDVVASMQLMPRVKHMPFQTWTLHVHTDNTAKLYLDDGNNGMHQCMQEIPYTDVPPSWRLTIWVVDGVAILPGEY